jgi:phosphohistidine swiveling domain-containing protein
VTVEMTAPAAAPIPLPAGFPVRFEPGDEQLFWERDRAHFPGQVTPLEAQFVATGVSRGITHGLERYAAPVAGMRTKVVGGYVYQAFVPMTGTPEELAAQGARSEAAMVAAIARLHDAWEEEWLPEILDHLAAMEAVDPRAVPTTVGLVDRLEDTWERMGRLWELHFEIVLPAYIAVSEFDELYRDLFDGAGFDAYRLLHGFPTRTFEVGCDLWRLSRIALRSPGVAEVLATQAAADVPEHLAQTEPGRALLDELDRHLAAFGHRTSTWGLATPTFIEDPTPVIKVLKDYATQPDSASPGVELDRLTAEREAAVAEARERLEGYPAPVVAQFEGLLDSAQFGLLLSEDHGFYIDAYATSLVRDLVSEMGRRLVAEDVLDDPEDALMLTYDELRVAGLDLSTDDPRVLVAQRRAELARYADGDVPPAFGTLPAGPPPDSPLTRFSTKFSGTGAGAPTVPVEPGVVRGASGSAGRATGPARVVRSLAEAQALEPGDVLVAEMTAPPWTPLFGVAAAVVTETGGILSHSAVVAREYGIPAVVGAATATTAIRDGDIVEVDGDAGTVRVVA